MPSDKVPFNEEAESSVIGSILINGESMTAISLALLAEDFFQEPNRWIFEACSTLYLRGEGMNQITVAAELERMGKLHEAGGVVYLAECLSNVPTSLHAEHYARIVHGCAVNRKLIQVAGRLAQLGYANKANIETTLEEAEGLVSGLRQGPAVKGLVPIRLIVEEYLANLAKPVEEKPQTRRIMTGLQELDRLLGGIQATDLLILAARTGVGKTSLLLNIASAAALGHNRTVAIFSVEMGKEQLLERLLSARSMVDSQHIRLGELDEEEDNAMRHAAAQLAHSAIWIDDSSTITGANIRSKSRLLHSQRGLDLVIVDYLQLLDGDGRRDNRVTELGDITKTLKGLAKELQIPVLAAAQLNRAVEYRKPHKPILSDLRESGNLEQDADVVMFLYCEDPDNKPDELIMEVAKHRHGPTGKVALKFVGEHTRFHGMEQKYTKEEERRPWWIEPF
ncbi:MAG: replicative DNA helicase [Dehalococcoidia bacterium]|nr:replicative DNA helicase [Dehalococcoidia bacterium]